jgi:acyl carrier protein
MSWRPIDSVGSIRGACHDSHRREIGFDAKGREFFAAKHLRTLIANHLGIDIKLVTDEAHFTDDLGADWPDLDRMIVIEERFDDVEISDTDIDQIERFSSPCVLGVQSRPLSLAEFASVAARKKRPMERTARH